MSNLLELFGNISGGSNDGLNVHTRGSLLLLPSTVGLSSEPIGDLAGAFSIARKFFSGVGKTTKVGNNKPTDILSRICSPDDGLEFAKLLLYVSQNKVMLRTLGRAVSLLDVFPNFCSSFSFKGNEIPGTPIESLRNIFEYEIAGGGSSWRCNDNLIGGEDPRGGVLSDGRLKEIMEGEGVYEPPDPDSDTDDCPAPKEDVVVPTSSYSVENPVVVFGHHEVLSGNPGGYSPLVLTIAQRTISCIGGPSFYVIWRRVIDFLSQKSVHSTITDDYTIISNNDSRFQSSHRSYICSLPIFDRLCAVTDFLLHRYPNQDLLCGTSVIPCHVFTDSSGADRPFVSALKDCGPPVLWKFVDVPSSVPRYREKGDRFHDIKGSIVTSLPGYSYFSGSFGSTFVRMPLSGIVDASAIQPDWLKPDMTIDVPEPFFDPCAHFSGSMNMFNAMAGAGIASYCRARGWTLVDIPSSSPCAIFFYPDGTVRYAMGSGQVIDSWRRIVTAVVRLRVYLWRNLAVLPEVPNGSDAVSHLVLALAKYSMGFAYDISQFPARYGSSTATWQADPRKCLNDTCRLSDVVFRPSTLACAMGALAERHRSFDLICDVLRRDTKHHSAVSSKSGVWKSDSNNCLKMIGKCYLMFCTNHGTRNFRIPDFSFERHLPPPALCSSQCLASDEVRFTYRPEREFFVRTIRIANDTKRKAFCQWIVWAIVHVLDIARDQWFNINISSDE